MSENLPVKSNGSNFALVFSQDERDIIRQTICPSQEFSEPEFKVAMMFCQTKGVNPILKQVYIVKRYSNGKATLTFITPIDVFRSKAQDSGQYAGQLSTQWCGEDGVWKDIWLAKTPPAAARVSVLRHDFKEPLSAIALYSDYAQLKDGKPIALWAKMPSLMLAKCAEALALRKAFPDSLGGLYTSDEMGQSGMLKAEVIDAEFTPSPKLERPPSPPQNDTFTEEHETPKPKPITDAQKTELHALLKAAKIEGDDLVKRLDKKFGVVETSALTEAQAASLIATLAGKAYDKEHTLTAMRKKLMAILGKLGRDERINKINEILEANALPGVNTSNDLDAAGLKLVLDVLGKDGEIDASDVKA